MAKAVKVKAVKKSKSDGIFPLERQNFIIIGIGILFILAGYVALSGNSVDGFSQLTIAPLLLLAGYCVIIPIGILYKTKTPSTTSLGQPPPQS